MTFGQIFPAFTMNRKKDSTLKHWKVATLKNWTCFGISAWISSRIFYFKFSEQSCLNSWRDPTLNPLRNSYFDPYKDSTWMLEELAPILRSIVYSSCLLQGFLEDFFPENFIEHFQEKKSSSSWYTPPRTCLWFSFGFPTESSKEFLM